MTPRPAIPELVLADRLRADEAFAGLAAKRIFHQIIPGGRGTQYPTVTMAIQIANQDGNDQTGRAIMLSTVTLMIQDTDFGRCKETANRAFAALNDFKDLSSRPPILRCKLSPGGESDSPMAREDNEVLYGVTQNYLVRWER